MTWQVTYKSPAAAWAAGDSAMELANGQPPYQWKHGWIPLTPDAKLIKAKKKSGTAKDSPVKVKVQAKTKPPAAISKTQRAEPKISATQQRMMELVEARGDGDPSDTPEGFDVGLKLIEEWHGLVDAKDLDQDEQDAIADYQFGETDEFEPTYRALNRMKRGDRKGIDPDTGEMLEWTDQNLQSALTKSVLTKDTVVFRGLSDGHPPLKTGDVVTDAAWVSTSTNPEMAMGFARHGSKDKARVMVIPLPKGTHAIQPESEDEWELLLGPDVPMRVNRIEGKYVYMELA